MAGGTWVGGTTVFMRIELVASIACNTISTNQYNLPYNSKENTVPQKWREGMKYFDFTVVATLQSANCAQKF